MGAAPRQIVVHVTTDQDTTALLYAAHTATRRPAALVLAHGAGAPQQHPFMVAFARAERARARRADVQLSVRRTTAEGARSDATARCMLSRSDRRRVRRNRKRA